MGISNAAHSDTLIYEQSGSRCWVLWLGRRHRSRQMVVRGRVTALAIHLGWLVRRLVIRTYRNLVPLFYGESTTTSKCEKEGDINSMPAH